MDLCSCSNQYFLWLQQTRTWRMGISVASSPANPSVPPPDSNTSTTTGSRPTHTSLWKRLFFLDVYLISKQNSNIMLQSSINKTALERSKVYTQKSRSHVQRFSPHSCGQISARELLYFLISLKSSTRVEWCLSSTKESQMKGVFLETWWL